MFFLICCLLIFIANIVATILATNNYYLKRIDTIKDKEKIIHNLTDAEYAFDIVTIIACAFNCFILSIIILVEFTSGSNILCCAVALMLFVLTWNIVMNICKKREVVIMSAPSTEAFQNGLIALAWAAGIAFVGTLLFTLCWTGIMRNPCNTQHVQTNTFDIVSTSIAISDSETKIDVLQIGEEEYKLYYLDDSGKQSALTVAMEDVNIEYIPEDSKACVSVFTTLKCRGYNRSTLEHYIDDDVTSVKYNVYIHPDGILKIDG